MTSLFADRADAGRRLAPAVRAVQPRHPLVLGIPRGGVEVAAALAAEIGAEVDVVLARKLRAPFQPELAIGAVSEDGQTCLVDGWSSLPGVSDAYVAAERDRQLREIERRRDMYRRVRPQVSVAGRDAFVTDDGIATGSTMIAALRAVRAGAPGRLTVAVPVASPDRLEAIRPLCDRVVCLLAPASFQAVGQFYRSFDQVEDDRVIELLRTAAPPRGTAGPSLPP